jgi:hypothetical protein
MIHLILPFPDTLNANIIYSVAQFQPFILNLLIPLVNYCVILLRELHSANDRSHFQHYIFVKTFSLQSMFHY